MAATRPQAPSRLRLIPSAPVSHPAATLQHSLEATVRTTPALRDQAALAFQAFVRSYATRDRKARDLFHFKTLHLGHVARSFGLVEAPSTLSSVRGQHCRARDDG